MEEKTLIKGTFKKANSLSNLFISLTVLCGVIAAICGTKDPYEYGYYDSTSSDIAAVFTILAIICAIVAVIVYMSMKNCEITVTDKKVYGKIKFGKRVDLPLNQISSIGQSICSSITVATSSGVIKFWLLANRDEVFSVLSDELNKFQNNEKAPVTITQSSDADELGKYKKLLEDGAITQEEYDAKKKQILGL